MDTQAIDTLKFKAYLKAPQGGSERVELCADKFGRLVVVKWATEAENGGLGVSREVPGSLVYDCFAERGDGSFLQYLPATLGNDTLKIHDRKMGRIVTEYCQGHDLEELINYASLSGEALPEPFLWHIINSFIEYCFALSTSHLDMTVFDPAQVLFTFDTPNYANTGESAELQYPRVVFCGLTGIDDLTDTYDPEEAASHDVSCTDAIRAFGAYLWSHVESIPSCNDQTVSYSQALISWLRIIAGTDDAPPRYIDLHQLLVMLHTRIDEYRGPKKALKLTPWLSRYFKQLRLESDTRYSAIAGLDRRGIHPEIDDYVYNITGPPPVHRFSMLPPVISPNEDVAKLAESLTIYIDRVTTQLGITQEQWKIRRWSLGVTPMDLEDIRQFLSKFMHQSLDRSIALSQWSGIWLQPTSNLTFKEQPRTRAIFDPVEPEIFQSLVRALARCQEAIAEQSRTELTDAIKDNSNQLDRFHKKRLEDAGRLLDEVQTCYQAALTKAVWDGDRWKWYHREVRSTIQVRSSFLIWEKWFAILIEGIAQARAFAQNPTSAKGESMEQFLRLELGLLPYGSLEKVAQDKIIARGDMATEWYKQKNAGHVYAVPEWKETSKERKARHIKYELYDETSWSDYLKRLRANGTRAAKALHSPKNMSPTDPPSPKARIAGKVEHATKAEEEYRKMTNRPRLAPRRRKDISKAELRVYKIFKRWKKNFATDNPWYTDANLWENFRQQLRRKSRDLEAIRTSFNRRGQGVGAEHSQLHPLLIRTHDDALKHIEWYLESREPMEMIERMSLCSSAADSTLPVEEKAELWDVSDSSGTEDGHGRWISKGDKKKRG
ncbi:MAG: hypothetical protein GOMPHAMPRED_002140 [Gomphillus americanus]|uniref:Protein kinase domain-containing protein n=1 Tax=Gomphillus americanus TaxID=1940652 RepID=A0A8H3IHA3_9LECA|nr:MAG: hypothetical protein GOMPHAMPRED_002140 [Gomphillus americanus]